jgi:amino acid permease
MFKKDFLQLFSAISIIAGTCIGAGFLGIPYVVSRTGFFVGVLYLSLFTGILLLINLYFGEIILRTKGSKQLSGYAKKYLGKKGEILASFATKFTIYSAIIAYLIGMGQSINFLFFSNSFSLIILGIVLGLLMSLLVWGGFSTLKKYEKFGVIIALLLLLSISVMFFGKVKLENFFYFDLNYFLLPFGVVLFSLTSFFSIPQAKRALGNNVKLLKKAIIVGTALPALFYLLFMFVVVGFKGIETPEIATFALGNIFVIMGIIAMFTSYLSLANALQENYIFDYRYSRKRAWFNAAIVPIFFFLLTQLFSDFFSFIRVLSIAGVISGGIIAILLIRMNVQAEKFGDKEPYFKIRGNKWVGIILTLIFLFGILLEILNSF